MLMSDEGAYEEMISALQKFKSSVQDSCDAIKNGAADLVDNTEGDDNATYLQELMDKLVLKIEENFSTIDGIIQALEEELEKLREKHLHGEE
jgi:DNA-binding transcriptional regulator GbsR (MarR family)